VRGAPATSLETCAGRVATYPEVVRRIGVVVLAALLLVDVVVAAGLTVLVVGALVGSDSDDPHGYALIFGLVALLAVVPIGLMLLGLLRRALRSAARGAPR